MSNHARGHRILQIYLQILEKFIEELVIEGDVYFDLLPHGHIALSPTVQVNGTFT